MAGIDNETIRHALRTAREYGFRTVRLKCKGASFKATLDTAEYLDEDQSETVSDQACVSSQEPTEQILRAPLVGYYKPSDPPLAVGQSVADSIVVAYITALGLDNEVLCKVSGEVVELLVKPGEPLEYGQPIARIRGEA